MDRLLRVVITWLMVIAMPVQGMAASTMLLCGPSHARMVQGLQPEAPAVHTAGHGHGDHGQLHAHGAADPVADAHQAADAAGNADLLSHHAAFNCSACAACCMVLALPAPGVPPMAAAVVQHLEAAPLVPVTSHQPDGPDRPPRNPLA